MRSTFVLRSPSTQAVVALTTSAGAGQAARMRTRAKSSQLQQPMLADIYGSAPVWTPWRLLRAAVIALIGGFVAGARCGLMRASRACTHACDRMLCWFRVGCFALAVCLCVWVPFSGARAPMSCWLGGSAACLRLRGCVLIRLVGRGMLPPRSVFSSRLVEFVCCWPRQAAAAGTRPSCMEAAAADTLFLERCSCMHAMLA